MSTISLVLTCPNNFHQIINTLWRRDLKLRKFTSVAKSEVKNRLDLAVLSSRKSRSTQQHEPTPRKTFAPEKCITFCFVTHFRTLLCSWQISWQGYDATTWRGLIKQMPLLLTKNLDWLLFPETNSAFSVCLRIFSGWRANKNRYTKKQETETCLCVQKPQTRSTLAKGSGMSHSWLQGLRFTTHCAVVLKCCGSGQSEDSEVTFCKNWPTKVGRNRFARVTTLGKLGRLNCSEALAESAARLHCIQANSRPAIAHSQLKFWHCVHCFPLYISERSDSLAEELPWLGWHAVSTKVVSVLCGNDVGRK